jgi:hypothetical protein
VDDLKPPVPADVLQRSGDSTLGNASRVPPTLDGHRIPTTKIMLTAMSSGPPTSLNAFSKLLSGLYIHVISNASDRLAIMHFVWSPIAAPIMVRVYLCL